MMCLLGANASDNLCYNDYYQEVHRQARSPPLPLLVSTPLFRSPLPPHFRSSFFWCKVDKKQALTAAFAPACGPIRHTAALKRKSEAVFMPRETLTVTDNRTGKSYEIPITHGTIKSMDLRQIKVHDHDFGMMTYDPAYNNTASCIS